MFEKYDMLHLFPELIEGLVGWQQACSTSNDPLDAFEAQEFGKPVVASRAGIMHVCRGKSISQVSLASAHAERLLSKPRLRAASVHS